MTRLQSPSNPGSFHVTATNWSPEAQGNLKPFDSSSASTGMHPAVCMLKTSFHDRLCVNHRVSRDRGRRAPGSLGCRVAHGM